MRVARLRTVTFGAVVGDGTGHNQTELPAGFSSAPITKEETDRWLAECRRTMPIMLRHCSDDAEHFEFVKKERDVNIWKCVPPLFPLRLCRSLAISTS